MGQKLAVIALASLPVPGLPPSAIDALGTANSPARFTKVSSYNAVEFGFTSTNSGNGSYALYRYWPTDKDWKPEGPRGATPMTIDMSTVAGKVPVRISMLAVETDVCVVLVSGAGIVNDGGLPVPCIIEAQNR